MDKRKAENISVILVVSGAILIILPFMGVFKDQQGSAILAGFFFLMSALLVRGLGKDQ